MAPLRRDARRDVHNDNPSRWSERLVLAALAACGVAISVYLAAYQLGAITSPWDPIFGARSSAHVLHSPLSRALPVPDAALGAAAYLAEIVTGLIGGRARWRTHPWTVLAFGGTAVGLGVVSVGLVAMQMFVLRDGCTLCLASAALSITIAVSVALGEELPAAWRQVVHPTPEKANVP